MTRLIALLLCGAAFGQVTPTHVLVTENLTDPTHPMVRATFPSTGADSYKVYEALIADDVHPHCPAFGSTIAQTQVWPDGSVHKTGSPAYVFDTTVLGGVPAADATHPFLIGYPDDPNPKLSQIPATSLAGARGWCYSVSSVKNGVESAPSVPQAVWLGFSAYYAWGYHTACNVSLSPYPYPPDKYHPRLYYRDPAGKDHQFAYVGNKVFVDAGGKGQDEVEFHVPVVALDGTMVPLLDASHNGQAEYFVELVTPDGYSAVETLIPYRQGDHAWYSAIGTGFVLGAKNYWQTCKQEPSPSWQDVSY